jgi:hypothetical protein
LGNFFKRNLKRKKKITARTKLEMLEPTTQIQSKYKYIYSTSKINEIPKHNESKPTKSPNPINSKPAIRKTQISKPTCRSTLRTPQPVSARKLAVDLANGSGQSGSTHVGSGQKTDRPKWVAQPMTLTRSFKGRVKTGLTRIFTHEKIYI